MATLDPGVLPAASTVLTALDVARVVSLAVTIPPTEFVTYTLPQKIETWSSS